MKNSLRIYFNNGSLSSITPTDIWLYCSQRVQFFRQVILLFAGNLQERLFGGGMCARNNHRRTVNSFAGANYIAAVISVTRHIFPRILSGKYYTLAAHIYTHICTHTYTRNYCAIWLPKLLREDLRVVPGNHREGKSRSVVRDSPTWGGSNLGPSVSYPESRERARQQTAVLAPLMSLTTNVSGERSRDSPRVDKRRRSVARRLNGSPLCCAPLRFAPSDVLKSPSRNRNGYHFRDLHQTTK